MRQDMKVMGHIVRFSTAVVCYNFMSCLVVFNDVALAFAYRYLFFILSTYASITATAVMLTMSRTELSKSVKCIGLFRPI